MKIVMNYKDYWPESKRWSWEERGQILLCTLDKYAESLREAIQGAVEGLLREFDLPVAVAQAAPDVERAVTNLVDRWAVERNLDCWEFLRSLNEERKSKRTLGLEPALMIAFDGSGRTLYDGPSQPEHSAEWGWTQDDGLILLRCLPDSCQPLTNLVRHEMGHLLGVGKHHDGCVMAWDCQSSSFCATCISTIEDACKIVP